jgi:hypothetical protein
MTAWPVSSFWPRAESARKSVVARWCYHEIGLGVMSRSDALAPLAGAGLFVPERLYASLHEALRQCPDREMQAIGRAAYEVAVVRSGLLGGLSWPTS